MKCPNCGGLDLAVIDVRPTDEGRATRRRRECAACKHRFNTFERVEGSEHRPISRHRSRCAARRDKGKCHDCPAAIAEGSYRCADCAEVHRIKDRARYAEQKALRERQAA